MKPIRKSTIRKFGGAILGWLEEDSEGNQQVRDFTGKIVGFYDKPCDVTREFSGKIVTQGNTVLGFLYIINVWIIYKEELLIHGTIIYN